MFSFLADIKLTNFAAKNTHILTNYIEHFDWNKMISSFLSTVFSLAVISVLFFLIHAIGKKLIKRSFAGARAKSSTVSQGRIETIYTLSQNIFHYCGFVHLWRSGQHASSQRRNRQRCLGSWRPRTRQRCRHWILHFA